MKFIRDYWSGQVGPLAVAMVLLGGAVAASLLAVWVPWRWAAFGAVIIFVIWQLVGGVRFADRRMKSRGGGPAWWVYGGGERICSQALVLVGSV